MENTIGIKIPNTYADRGGKKRKKKRKKRKKTKPLKRTSQRRKSRIGAAPTGRVNLGFNQPLFGPRRVSASSFASRALMIGGHRRPFVFTPRALAHSRRNHLSNLAVFTKPPVSMEEFAQTFQTYNIFRNTQQTDNLQPARAAAAAQMGQILGGEGRVRGRQEGREQQVQYGEPIVQGEPIAEAAAEPIYEHELEEFRAAAAPPPPQRGPVGPLIEPRHQEVARYIMAQEAGLVPPYEDAPYEDVPVAQPLRADRPGGGFGGHPALPEEDEGELDIMPPIAAPEALLRGDEGLAEMMRRGRPKFYGKKET